VQLHHRALLGHCPPLSQGFCARLEWKGACL
jgi:hypothetical protein